ncbi:MAG: AAA family ATPase [Planctomycetes bacterium]|nr:AAA family ATPase [Planctomycetota bacterium]
MKILHLDLKAFGPFTEKRLNFDRGQEGLHIVFGANEAGKSSALRALRDALYGVPTQSLDNFVHDHRDMRIGIALSRRDGQVFDFVRRKGKAKTLLDSRSNEPLDEGPLLELLAGVTRPVFESMFGLDYQSLIDGGRQITLLEGDIGPMLFAAAGGIANLREVQRALEKEADGLFKSSGSLPKLNAAMRQLDDSKKAIKDIKISSKQYSEYRDGLTSAEGEQERILKQLGEIRKRMAQLERFVSAIPLFARRRDLLRKLELLQTDRPMPQLRPDFHRDCSAARIETTAAQGERKQAVSERQSIEDALRDLDVPQAPLAHRGAINQLTDPLGAHRKAQKDLRESIRPAIDSCRDKAAAILRYVRPDLSLDDHDQLQLSQLQKLELRNLAARHVTIIAEQRGLAKQVDDKRNNIRADVESLQNLEQVPETTLLKQSLFEWQPHASLEDELAKLVRQREKLQRELSAQLSRLGRWSGSLEELERLPVPALETIDRYEREIQAAQLRSDELAKKRKEADGELGRILEGIEKLRDAGGQPPTEDDLSDARRIRDEGWRLVRAAWQSEASGSEAQAEFIARADPGANDLATAYEHSVAGADLMADRLRREAQRVAQQAGLIAQQHRVAHEREQIDEQSAQAGRSLQTMQTQWEALWQPLAIEPATPKEMRSWQADRQRIVDRIPDLQELQSGELELASRLGALRQTLSRQLEEFGQAPLDAQVSFKDGLARGAALVKRWEEAARDRQQLEKNLRRQRGELTKLEEELQSKLDGLDAWKNHWGPAVEPLGLPADATPDQLNEAIDRLEVMFDNFREVRQSEDRAVAIAADAEKFAARLSPLWTACGLEGLLPEVDVAAQRLIDLLRAAEAASQKQADLQERKSKLEEQLRGIETRITRSQAALQALCQEAGCDSPDELDECWRLSQEVVGIKNQLREVEQSLIPLTAGETIDELEREVQQKDADTLNGELQACKDKATELDAQRLKLAETIGEQRVKLNAIGADPDKAIELSARVQSDLAQIEEQAVEYARVKLAAVILRRAIERFNERNQGPVLSRAGEVFRALTKGAFSGLRIDYDDKDRPILVGIRAGTNSGLPIASMSEGTADQIYFALRLGYLAHWLEHHEPMPLVVDDVLIKFDNDRALATLQVLSEFSRRTQVILFTHHLHLVELARQHFTNDVLFEQTL